MGDFFGSGLTFVFIAVIVAARIFMMIRRRMVNRQAPERPAPTVEREAEYEGVFSAWDLPVSPREAAPPPAAVPKPADPSLLSSAPAMVWEAIPVAASRAPAPVASPQGPSPARTGAGADVSLRSLSSLRRGIILAEILGPPKGL
jgi:hypothetical protein